MEWEGLEKGGIFEGFGMNEEGRRELGRGRGQTFTDDGFLELPHASFGFRFTRSAGPLDVVMRSICRFPVPRLAARPTIRADHASFIFLCTATSSLLSLKRYLRHTFHVPVSTLFPCPCPILASVLAGMFPANYGPQTLEACTLSTTNGPLRLLCSSLPFRHLGSSDQINDLYNDDRLSLHAFRCPPLLAELVCASPHPVML